MSGADLFEANCSHASLRGVIAVETVFFRADLTRTVFEEADLRKANFKESVLARASFSGAKIGGAQFAGATEVPAEVAALLGPDGVAPAGTVVPTGDPAS
jgi:uncharacterized protein YjbI with pentapeptide repeats